MPRNWQGITADHVVEAIRRYDEHPERYSRARHTFVLYDGKRYPAKAIRGIAYQVCFGETISQEAFTGGQETARFFQRLKFSVVSGSSAPSSLTPGGGVRPHRKRRPGRHLDPVTQKNALQALLQKHFRIVIAEKGFDWLRVPRPEAFDPLYTRLLAVLRDHRGHDGFIQPGRRLTVDFHVETLNLVIEYDEDQHFSQARQLALESYPEDLPLGFSPAEWRDACIQVRAADSDPPSRDETRAFYDAVRDIEVPRHGMSLLRIRHGAVDWEGPDAEKALLEMLKPYRPTDDTTTPSARLSSDLGDRTRWRELEIEFQRIRLNYLKWFFHFTPPKSQIIPGCGEGDGFLLLESDYGRSFTAFPCGLGSVYVGAGKGCICLPRECFSHVPQLDEETRYLKGSLQRRTQTAREEIIRLLDMGNLDDAWQMLFEYWWIKLGLHEYAHDVAYEVRPDGDELPALGLRDYLLTAMYRSRTLDTLDTSRFTAADLRRFARYGMRWNRFACCAFDCGPIAVGKEGYVPYAELAAARRRFFANRNPSGTKLQEKRAMARAALEPQIDFLMLYFEEPLSLAKTFRGFCAHREALRAKIHDTQQVLNAIVKREQLDLPVLTYAPE